MFNTKFKYKIKMRIFFSVNPPPPPHENLAVYDILWENMVQQDSPQMTV
jgi:hypothetical protein